mgnify:CR=1 FL=1
MRIKFYFSILVLFLLGLGGVLLYLAKGMKPLHLYIVEGIIAFILVFLFIFYRKIVKPMNIIGSGMELLREQDFSSRLSKVGQYEADRIVNVFNRMMEQLKNERLRLREQNHFLDLLIQASPMGVVITTLNGEISQLNPMGLKMMGVRLEEIMGKKIENIDSPLAEELANISKDQTAVVRLNDSNIYKCTHSSFIDRGFHHPFYLIEKMTDEVMRAEKKAYEKVIRMIAHEVNNTTAGITSTLDTVEQALSTEEDMEDICDVMRVCTERCFSMSRFITRFADVVKIPEPALVTGKLNELASMCKRFMEGMCNDRNILLWLECDPKLEPVRFDAALLEQVLVNIIKNAAESIGQGGDIFIRTSVSPVMLEIADSGKGISKEVETKLFSPFFSTKPNGQGIGLIFIREVLTRLGCTFSLRTYADGLTRFRISFPERRPEQGKDTDKYTL